MKLMRAAIRLLHHKEIEAIRELHAILCLGQKPQEWRGYQFDEVWSWGLRRWGEKWVRTEYDMREGVMPVPNGTVANDPSFYHPVSNREQSTR